MNSDEIKKENHIDELQDQFFQLINIVQGLQQQVMELKNSNQVLVKANQDIIKWVDVLSSDFDAYKENISYEIRDELEELTPDFFPEIRSREEAIDFIINEGKSLARFGDGEFSAMQGLIRHKFQSNQDQELASRLKEIILSDENNLLIGIAPNYGSLKEYSEQTKREIRHYMTREVREFHLECLSRNKVYFNAYLTRPYVVYADNQTDGPAKRFTHLRQIWNEKKCIFVEGLYTRMGVGNDLFDNAKSISRILCPAENAFSRYNEIYEECKKQPKDVLFLIALGPTATVLAHDLCKSIYQAVDIGHLDLEYEWFLKNQGRRTAITTKYNNEFPEGDLVEDLFDEKYESQVIARIY